MSTTGRRRARLTVKRCGKRAQGTTTVHANRSALTPQSSLFWKHMISVRRVMQEQKMSETRVCYPTSLNSCSIHTLWQDLPVFFFFFVNRAKKGAIRSHVMLFNRLFCFWSWDQLLWEIVEPLFLEFSAISAQKSKPSISPVTMETRFCQKKVRVSKIPAKRFMYRSLWAQIFEKKFQT